MRNILIYVDIQLKILFPCSYIRHVIDVIEKRRKLVFHRNDLHLAGLDLGEVKDIIDKCQKSLTGPLDIPGIAQYILIRRFTKDHLIKTKNGIDRGSDLMGYT